MIEVKTSFGNFHDNIVIFQDFCNQVLDVRSANHIDELQLLQSEFPPLWNNLHEILVLENSDNWLPDDVAAVVLALINKRISTFENSAERFSTDYVRYCH